jgi:hypothetical protein
MIITQKSLTNIHDMHVYIIYTTHQGRGAVEKIRGWYLNIEEGKIEIVTEYLVKEDDRLHSLRTSLLLEG